jgi:hypothetical protein
MAYLLDANVFIQAKNLHYGLDFCPAFWHWLDQANAAGTAFSIEKVGDELKGGADNLTTWASTRTALFLSPGPEVIASLRAVSAWASNETSAGRYTQAALSTFLQVADYYLVAQAHAGGYTVVTHEVIDNAVRRIKIPQACLALGIRCVNPFEMLRVEKARFLLGS